MDSDELADQLPPQDIARRAIVAHLVINTGLFDRICAAGRKPPLGPMPYLPVAPSYN
jgi:hypothetical protein